MLKRSKLPKAASLLLAVSLLAAACGADDDSSADVAAADQTEEATTDEAMEDEAMEDDAMEDDAMEDEEAMEDDAMEDEEAMEDDAMEDEDAMEDDAMEDEDAMEDDAMEDEDAMEEELSSGPFELTFDGLEPLGEGFVYEGWVVIDDAPVSTGRFTIEADGSQLFHSESLVDDVSGGSAFILTIEPAVGDDPAPADAHVLAGDLVDGSADLTVAHPAALGDDFSTAGGQFVLATPTSASTDDELSGVWFITLNPTSAGLELPELPAGWVYEGWAVIDGQPVTTGRFTDPGAADDFNGFSGTDATGPAYPGEDFIMNAPDGLTFPTDLTGTTVVISIEPEDDDSPAPFAFKPLLAEVPAGIGDHEGIELGAGPAFPTGTATVVDAQ